MAIWKGPGVLKLNKAVERKDILSGKKNVGQFVQPNEIFDHSVMPETQYKKLLKEGKIETGNKAPEKKTAPAGGEK